MTNPEVINKIERNVCSHMDWCEVRDCEKCAVESAIEALEKQEKYKWHDLRKDPSDLPETNGNDESDYVLVMIGCPEWNHWERAYYKHSSKMWSTFEQNIFAWKYIEPFESEENSLRKGKNI